MFTINFDFDGTLYVWDSSKSLEDVGKTNYPMEQEHIWPMLYAAERLNNDFPGLVRICSAVLNERVESSKKRRISRDIGSDVANRSIFTTFGESKVASIEGKGRKKVSIKAYNGINGTKGTWTGYSVHTTTEPEICYKQLKAIIDCIVEESPETDILISDFSEELREWEAA